MDNITLFPDQPKQPQIQLSQEAIPSQQYASNRAYQFTYGLGDLTGKTFDDVYPQMQRGEEPSLRREAAALVNQGNLAARLDKIRQNPQMAGTFMDEPLQQADPNFVMEQAFARKYMSKLAQSIGESDVNDAQKAAPETTNAMLDNGTWYAAQARLIANKLQEAADKREGQSFFSKAVDFGKDFATFGIYSQLKETGGIGFMGNRLEATVDNYLRMPPAEFMAKFPKEIDKLIADNPSAAIDLLTAMYGISHSDKMYRNVMSVVDFASIPGAGLIASKLGAFNRGVRSMLRAQSLPESVEVAAARGAGNIRDAAALKASEHIEAELRGEDTGLKKMWDTMTTHMKSVKEQAKDNWGNSSRELLTRVLDRYDSNPQKVWDAVMRVIRPERTELHRATPEQVKQLMDEINNSYPRYKDGQLDITGPHEDPLTKTSHFALHMGNTKGELFKSEEQAKVTSLARTHIRDLEVVQEGNGYKYIIPLPIPETHPLVQELALKVPEALPQHNMLNSWIGWLRNPGDTLAHDQMLNRVAASYAPSNFYKLFREEAKEIQKLRGTFWRKKGFRDFEDFVKSGQQELDADGLPGKDYKGAADINQWYTLNKGRVATDQEIAAYFAFKRINEMDWMLRQIMVNTNKARIGAKNYRVYHASKEGNVVYSPYFDATEITPSQSFPVDYKASGLVIGKNGKHEIVTMTPSLEQRLSEGFMQGKVKILRIYEPYEKPLSKYSRSQNPVLYVITDQFERRELQWDSLPHRGGGHFEYTYDHYIKEPMFSKDTATNYWHYQGDRTIAAVSIRGMGQDFADNMNKIRKLIREGKLDEARDLHNKTMPDESWDDHLGMYSSTGSGATYKPARMDLNSDVYVVPNNKMISDVHDGLFDNPRFTSGKDHGVVNGTRGYSDANMSQIQFTGERDVFNLRSVGQEGTRQNPLFRFSAADQVDPLPMLNRAWNRLINNFFVDDVKKSAIEAWTTQAKKYLKPRLAAEADSAPYRVFMEAGGNSFKQGDQDIVKQLLANKDKIDQFIGTPSRLDSFIWQGAQKIADSIYTKTGKDSFALVPTKMLPYVKDPFRAIRSIVFNEKVGLFSIPQFMVHLTTYSTLLGVAGVQKAIPGTMAAMLHMWAGINPHILDHLDRLASNGLVRFGKAGEFKEANKLLRDTGFNIAEHEHAQIDSIMTNQIVRSGTAKFLHWGQFFFRSGLTSVRVAAWYTAYKEFREVNPLKVIGNAEKLEILNRADLLAHNMSRAHSSILNQGVLANTTQFYTYQQRLIEMMFPFFGKRLSTVEKFRLFATNALLFGVPIAAATTPLGIGPITSYMKGIAAQHGYVVGDKFWSSMFNEGGIDQISALVNGGGDWAKGEHYNYGGRYGTKGLEWDQMREDQHIWEWALGASYETGVNTLEESDGLIRGIFSGIKTAMGIPQPEGETYPMSIDDLIRPLREVSIVNVEERARMAVHTGAWWSKNGRKMEDQVSVGEALFMSLLGLQRQSTEDTFMFSGLIKGEKGYEDETRRKFFTVMGRYYQAMSDNDPEQAKDYFEQGRNILISRGYPIDQYSKVYAEATKTQRALASKVAQDYRLRNVPMGRRDTARESFRAQQEVNKAKGIE